VKKIQTNPETTYIGNTIKREMTLGSLLYRAFGQKPTKAEAIKRPALSAICGAADVCDQADGEYLGMSCPK